MSQLYSVNLEELSKPVKQLKKTTLKKPRKTPTSPPATEPSEQGKEGKPVPPPPTPEVVPPEETAAPPAKKQKTEKQLAALERAREKRRMAKEEKERVEKEVVEQEAAAAAIQLAKKEALKEKRRLAREQKLAEIEPEEKAKVIASRRSRPVYREENDPPVWFKKYIETVKTEQSKLGAEKKASKTIKEEAQHEANEFWKDEPSRSRVTHEVDKHMDRMYSMIFNKR
jgi:hypothetical protein